VRNTLEHKRNDARLKDARLGRCTSEESVPGNALGEKMIVFMKEDMKRRSLQFLSEF
jgi:hypothetical protein